MWKQWKQKHMRKVASMADYDSQFDNKMCLLIFGWLVDGLQQIQKLPLVDAALQQAAHAQNEKTDHFETAGDAMESMEGFLSGSTRYVH